MSFVRGTLNDLRQRRLWPVAVALLVGLVAVPVLLTRSAKPATVPTSPAAGLPTSLPAGPTVSSESSPGQAQLRGRARDPFNQQVASTTTSASPASPTTSTSTTGSTGSTGSTGTTGAAGTSPSTSTTGAGASPTSPGTTTTTTTTTTSTPTPAGLKHTQSYRVAVAFTNASGGFDTTDPLKRLSLLPSEQEPLLIELGALDGGKRVLFAVQPGTVVTGPGACTPGPIDCSVLSLAENQTENVSKSTTTGKVPVGSFAITAIGVDDHSSVAEANKARAEVSAAGRKLLNKSTADALSLFQYDASVGAVLDLRNLTVGGGS